VTEILISPTFLPDWHAAEIAAVEHMRSLGFIDAQTTAAGADGGIDAQSSDAAAQVKFYASSVGRPDVQRLLGASHAYRLALFYSTGGYTAEAVAYANQAGVALFLMDPYGMCESASDFARLLVEPKLIKERKGRLEDLRAARYLFAIAATESDLNLFIEFKRNIEMEQEEDALFAHVLADLQTVVRDFRVAVESKRFELADIAFSEIQGRTTFLSWVTGPTLRMSTRPSPTRSRRAGELTPRLGRNTYCRGPATEYKTFETFSSHHSTNGKSFFPTESDSRI
jgi:hypothetical protein